SPFLYFCIKHSWSWSYRITNLSNLSISNFTAILNSIFVLFIFTFYFLLSFSFLFALAFVLFRSLLQPEIDWTNSKYIHSITKETKPHSELSEIIELQTNVFIVLSMVFYTTLIKPTLQVAKFIIKVAKFIIDKLFRNTKRSAIQTRRVIIKMFNHIIQVASKPRILLVKIIQPILIILLAILICLFMIPIFIVGFMFLLLITIAALQIFFAFGLPTILIVYFHFFILIEVKKNRKSISNLKILTSAIITIGVTIAGFISNFLYYNFVTLLIYPHQEVPFVLILKISLYLALYYGIVWAGGSDLIKYGGFRLILGFSGIMPWNITRFLDYCTERLILQRVGNRYRFIHRLVQEHFANLEIQKE
ncbi:hypothetical protein V6O07_10540, partial [Arthrospira platensis SPKY2]